MSPRDLALSAIGAAASTSLGVKPGDGLRPFIVTISRDGQIVNSFVRYGTDAASVADECMVALDCAVDVKPALQELPPELHESEAAAVAVQHALMSQPGSTA